MAESAPITLESPAQTQLREEQEMASRYNLSLLGGDLERLLKAIKGEQEEIGTRLDLGFNTMEQYTRDIETLHRSQLILKNAREQWEKTNDSQIVDSMQVKINDIEFITLHLITDLQVKIGELQASISVKRTDSVDGAAAEIGGDKPSYGATLAAVKPDQTIKKKSSRGSKRSKKTSSSTAMKLKLKTDEAALTITEHFDKERSERSMRIINRDAARAAEDAERAARRRLEELEDERVERAEAIRKKREIIRAKGEVIESFSEYSTEGTKSDLAGETEISPEEKTAAFVSNSPFTAQSSRPQLEAITSQPVYAPVPTYSSAPVMTSLAPITESKRNYTFPSGMVSVNPNKLSLPRETMFSGLPYPISSIPSKPELLRHPINAPTNLLYPVNMATNNQTYPSVGHESPNDIMSFHEQPTPSDPFPQIRGAGSIPTTEFPFNLPLYTAPADVSSHLSWAPRRGHTEGGVTPKSRSNNVRFTSSTPADSRPVMSEVLKFPDSVIHKSAHAFTPAYVATPTHVNNSAHAPPGYAIQKSTDNPENYEQYGQVTTNNQSSTNQAMELMCGQLALTRIPIGEPAIFDGSNPRAFPLWKVKFDALTSNKIMTDTDRVSLLSRYLSGEAGSAIEGYLTLPPEMAYHRAYHLLIERYGDKFELANSYCSRLRSWPRIGGSDTAGLRHLVDYLQQCLTAKSTLKGLSILDVESEMVEITKKLPVWLSRDWSRRVANYRKQCGEFPPFEDFVNFLAREDEMAHDPFTRALHKSETSKALSKGTSFAAENTNLSRPGNSFGACAFCHERHSILSCTKFRIKAVEFRRKFIRENRLCFACLGSGHQARECGNRRTCEICQGRHPTIMHVEEDRAYDSKTNAASATTCAVNNLQPDVPIKSSMVVPVYISHVNDPNTERVIFAMLDSQSDSSFITEETAVGLGVEGTQVRLSLSTMTSKDQIIKCKRFEGLQVRGFNSQRRIKLPGMYSQTTIPINRDHIPCPEMLDAWPYLERLRDQLMPKGACEVGILIGYDCSRALVPCDVITPPGDAEGPFGQKTPLGWGIVRIISQPTDAEPNLVTYSHRILTSQTTGSQIVSPRTIKELISPADCLKALEGDLADQHQGEAASQDERLFLRIMEENIKVDASANYSMPLPFNKHKKGLFNNKNLVLNRTASLKRKLDKDAVYHKEYTQFMEDMFNRGFAEEVPDQQTGGFEPVWYVPHFGVFHKTKKKIRVVFDCAAKYKGISLNDTLLKGPDFTNSLVGILCRFRKHSIAFGCDVEKMFYAFHVHPEDRDFLRFLWWKEGDTSRPLTTYRMTAHLFGAISSPACATFGLRYMAREFPEYGADVLDFIGNDFYVDDGLKSVSSEETAISLVKRTVTLCKVRGVRLHKFSSNSENLLRSLPESECAIKVEALGLDLDEYPTERVLGVLWDIELDAFRFRVTATRKPETRREILSVTSSIFDPLGWIAAFTLRARSILQRTCRDGADWDDKVESSILSDWNQWYRETKLLERLRIVRCWQREDYHHLKAIELHHFCDASEVGHGACSYLRTVNSSGEVSVHLVMAKARVAPLASVTIPRLELMAAVVAARLSVILEKELRLERVQHFYWTDSSIVLGYLHNDSKRFKTFVANRIQEIHDVSQPSQWRHIPGQLNPADFASRGLKGAEIINSQLWFQGPPFLKQEVIILPATEIDSINPNDLELRKVFCNASRTTEQLDIFNFSLFSEWKSLTRGIARAKLLARMFKSSLLMGSRLRSSTKSGLEPLRVADLQDAELLIIKTVQQAYFSEEMESLRAGEALTNNELKRLDCFLDKFGVLRVGGRLRFTSLYSALKHPVVLPKGAHVSELLIRDCHQGIKHQGRGMTVNEVRSRGYWVINLNSLVKHLIRKCVTCQALRGTTQGQKMADLPADRAECSPPFTYVGVDIFGPFLVKNRRTLIKRYGAIFTCLTTRAIHIEMTYDLTTDAFIQALRRFLAMRGPIRLLRCDNGTNFVGANKELTRSIEVIRSEALKKFVLDNNCDIDFRFNPPHASHMGGAWERLIRVVRSVLSTTLDKHSTRLDDSALTTFLYEAAAVVNTRPLSLEHVTDPTHPEPLTPNHLLTGKSRIVLPPPGEFSQGDTYSIKRWRGVQFLADQFWQRWRKEYLQYLQLRSKWQRHRREVRVGDVVLLVDANAPRNDWRRGMITEVFISQDGFVRSARLRTGRNSDGENSTLIRPVHKLVLLLPSEESAGDKAPK